jgi:hypothetical protein
MYYNDILRYSSALFAHPCATRHDGKRKAFSWSFEKKAVLLADL